MKLEQKIDGLEKQKDDIRKQIGKRNANRKIQCKSCDQKHKICDLEAMQTHWYTPPSGCTEGDHWNSGELHFICPNTGVRNRLLFFNYDIPYEKRSHYAYDPEAQFKRIYIDLFKKVTDEYDESKRNSVNNEYIDKHRKQFGIVIGE